MTFSERLGYKPVRSSIQIEFVDPDLKISLWNTYYTQFLSGLYDGYGTDFTDYANKLTTDLWKEPVDEIDRWTIDKIDESSFKQKIKNYYFAGARQWYDYYDIIEFTIPFADKSFVHNMNLCLEKEKSGYRIVKDCFVPIISEIEIKEIEDAFHNSKLINPVQIHLNEALKLLSDKKSTDYRNSVKESISAIESLSKVLTNNNKIQFSEAMAYFEKTHSMHPALKKSFSALYGYTSDDKRIRHALIEGDKPVEYHEAQFMLIVCSAFINYLISLNNKPKLK